jgi:hypothetical protein
MKNSVKRRDFPDVRSGFSTLFEWAFGPRNPMKTPVKLRHFPDVRSGFSPLSPTDVRGIGAANQVSRTMNDDVNRRGCSPLNVS